MSSSPEEALAALDRIMHGDAPPPLLSAPDGEAGTITLAMLDQLFDDLWNQRIRWPSVEDEIAMDLAVRGVDPRAAGLQGYEVKATSVPFEIAWGAIPEGAAGWRTVGLTPCWVLARMPDGMLAEGTGPTAQEAMGDARRNWVRWKRANPAPLVVDGREYRRRLRARSRRKR